jgi:fructoselysine 6-kinase
LKRQYVGGISLNFAVYCKRSGAESVSLVSRVGRDNSDRILKKLDKEDIDTSHVKVFEGATAKQNIIVNAEGDRIFPPGGYHTGVLKGYQLHNDDLTFIQQHNLLASSLFQQLEPLFFQVYDFPFDGWRVADFLDLSDYNKEIRTMERIIDRLSIAFVSGDHHLVERLRPLSRATRCLIVITLGAEGSVALVNGEPVYQQSLKVSSVVDSTGCGDAFQAAFTVSYWNDGNVSSALQNGAKHAAHVLQQLGAVGD